ncbi:MAG: sensor histidine kinase [Hyphomicrobium sp.]
MARASSAMRRDIHALAQSLRLNPQSIASHLFGLSKFEFSRIALTAAAATLTLAGVALPHIAPEVMSTVLFLTGATLALAVALYSSLGDYDGSAIVKFAEDAPVSTRPVTKPASRTLTELIRRSETRPSADIAAWARLTARMSHELRTPLNAVIGFSELMSAEVFGPLGSDRYCAYARDIHASGRTLLKSAEDALAITALLTGSERRPSHAGTNLLSAIDEAAAFHITDLAERRIALTCDAAADLDVMTDPPALRQIMINLIATAVEISRAGDGISLTANRADDRVVVDVVCDGNRVGPSDDCFSLLLAHTLAELSGALIVETRDAGTGWTISVTFVSAAQRDFFTGLGAPAA